MPRWSRRARATLAAALVLPLASGLAAEARAQETGIVQSAPMPVGVVVNGHALAEPGMVAMRDGHLLARGSDVASWNLTAKSFTPVTIIEGEMYVALDGVKGLCARLDAEGATLLVDAEASLFPRFAQNMFPSAVQVAAAIPAQFVDYDLTVSAWNGDTRLTGLVDAGVSGAWGVAGSSFLLDSDRRSTVRLDTSVRRDFPDRRMRLVLGDTVGRGAPWSRPVRYGGLFLGTDFSLDPQAINFPLPMISGSALTPSTVELLSESSRRSLDVGPGTFDLSLQPRLTGAGQVTMSVRDLSGQTRQVTRSFYTSANLLRPGLSEFAIEAGALRQNFGLDSFAYGPLFAAADLRRGVTGTLTLEGRLELSAATRMAGLGGAMVIGSFAEIAVSGAVSQGRSGTGTLIHAQAQRATTVYTLTASYERADSRFRQVGEARSNGGGRSELAIAAGLSLGRLGSLSASYARLHQGVGGAQSSRFDLASASYSTTVRGGYLSIGVRYAAHRDGWRQGSSTRDLGAFGSLTVPLGPRRHVSAIAEQGRIGVTYDHSLPDASGAGVRALAGMDRGSPWLEGGVSYRTGAGDLRLDAAWRRGQQGVQANARGGLLRVDGTVLATQRIDDGFALVDVASDTPVTVLVENRARPRKAGSGRSVIVTGLQPYAENHIAVDPADMPIAADLDASAKVVTPGWRQAVRVSFGAAGKEGARLRLVDGHGIPIRTGATFSWIGGRGVVGYDGEIWIDDYTGGAVVRVSSGLDACRAVMPELSGPALLLSDAAVPCVPETEWADAHRSGADLALGGKEVRP